MLKPSWIKNTSNISLKQLLSTGKCFLLYFWRHVTLQLPKPFRFILFITFYYRLNPFLPVFFLFFSSFLFYFFLLVLNLQWSSCVAVFLCCHLMALLPCLCFAPDFSNKVKRGKNEFAFSLFLSPHNTLLRNIHKKYLYKTHWLQPARII